MYVSLAIEGITLCHFFILHINRIQDGQANLIECI